MIYTLGMIFTSDLHLKSPLGSIFNIILPPLPHSSFSTKNFVCTILIQLDEWIIISVNYVTNFNWVLGLVQLGFHYIINIISKTAIAKHGINLGHHTKFHDTSTLAKKSRCVECIIREVTTPPQQHKSGRTFFPKQVMEVSSSEPEGTKHSPP